MIMTLIGIILLLIPFLLINRFSDKKTAFFYMLIFLIFFHLIIAIITQFLGIFKYPIILSINIVFCIIVFINFNNNNQNIIQNIKKIKIDWIFAIVFIILFIELCSIHYNYSGKINTLEGIKQIKNIKNIYPYYSDEWSAVSLVKYSIQSGKLAFVNHLTKIISYSLYCHLYPILFLIRTRD